MSDLGNIPDFKKTFWKEVGDELCDRIRVQTQVDGKDVYGKPFKKYSQGYVKEKKKRGGVTGKVNLTLTGDMMNGLQTRGFTNKSVVIGWSGTNARKIEGNTKQGRVVTTSKKPISTELGKYLESALNTQVGKNIKKETSKPITYTISK